MGNGITQRKTKPPADVAKPEAIISSDKERG
jgi:hypothetical protein